MLLLMSMKNMSSHSSLPNSKKGKVVVVYIKFSIFLVTVEQTYDVSLTYLTILSLILTELCIVW